MNNVTDKDIKDNLKFVYYTINKVIKNKETKDKYMDSLVAAGTEGLWKALQKVGNSSTDKKTRNVFIFNSIKWEILKDLRNLGGKERFSQHQPIEECDEIDTNKNPENTAEILLLKKNLDKILASVSETTRKIFLESFINEEGVPIVAARYSLTKARIYQIQKGIIDKLKFSITSKETYEA